MRILGPGTRVCLIATLVSYLGLLVCTTAHAQVGQGGSRAATRIQALQEKRYELLDQAAAQLVAQYQTGTIDLARLMQVGRDSLRAIAEGNDILEKRLAKLRQCERMARSTLEIAEAKQKGGLVAGVDVTQAESFLLEVQIEQLRATASAERAQEKPTPLTEWEFKAALIGVDEKEATRKLVDLASMGWQYVGPLGNGLVAFRRPLVPKEQVLVEVSGNPRTVAPGEKTTITVTVRAGDRSLLPAAKVTVSAGGGRFLLKPDMLFDPKERLHGPYSATGTTNEKGQFTTWWVCNPAAPGYVLGIEASKEGYTSGKAEHTIRIK